jgi:TRAP-type uncharacterized transport system substrate-binding protein
VLSLAETRQIKLVPVSDEEFAAINAADPTLIRYVYPAGAYRGIEETPRSARPT